MTLSQRDRRALLLLGAAVLGYVLLQFALPNPASETKPGASLDSIPAAERTLQSLRRRAATAPGEQEALKRVTAELAEREKALIDAQTGQQAQAHLLEIVRNVARTETPAVVLKNLELGQIRPYGKDYGEVLASASMECKIEELLNLLAGITAQKELVAISELRVTSTANKQKTVGVRLTVSGLIPRKLIPEKKGLASF